MGILPQKLLCAPAPDGRRISMAIPHFHSKIWRLTACPAIENVADRHVDWHDEGLLSSAAYYSDFARLPALRGDTFFDLACHSILRF